MLFNYFPSSEKLIGKNLVQIKDIIRKVTFDSESINRDRLYSVYYMKDGETLESVAREAYGREELSWVSILFNQIQDPLFDAPLSTSSFDNYMNKKYEGQTLFISPEGASGPFFTNNAGFTQGDPVILNDGGTYDASIRAYVKSFDPALSKLQVFNQVEKFKSNQNISLVLNNKNVLTATIAKAVEGREALHHFATSITSEHFDPLGSIPNTNGIQTALGATSSDFTSAAVTLDGTLLTKYMWGGYSDNVITVNEFENYENAKRSRVKIPNPSIIPRVELEIRKLLQDA